MKRYIIFDDAGISQMTISARSQREAEKKARKMFGENATAVYTED